MTGPRVVPANVLMVGPSQQNRHAGGDSRQSHVTPAVGEPDSELIEDTYPGQVDERHARQVQYQRTLVAALDDGIEVALQFWCGVDVQFAGEPDRVGGCSAADDAWHPAARSLGGDREQSDGIMAGTRSDPGEGSS